MQQPHKLPNNFKRIFKAGFYSLQGLRSVFRSSIAFRQGLYLGLLLLPIIIFISVTLVEKVILFACWVLVLVVEIINSALEATVDRISLELHPLSKQIKDMGSAAVLLTIGLALIIWVVILINHYC